MFKLLKLIALILVALFCWGWVANVYFGKMTTEQYIRMINNKIDQWVISGSERVLATPALSSATRNWQTYYAGGRG